MHHAEIMEQIYMLAAVRDDIKNDPKHWDAVQKIDRELADLSQLLPRE